MREFYCLRLMSVLDLTFICTADGLWRRWRTASGVRTNLFDILNLVTDFPCTVLENGAAGNCSPRAARLVSFRTSDSGASTR